MKIQKLTIENRAKDYALLHIAFPGSDYETGLVQKFHENGRPIHEWVCIHSIKVIAYTSSASSGVFRGQHMQSPSIDPFLPTD